MKHSLGMRRIGEEYFAPKHRHGEVRGMLKTAKRRTGGTGVRRAASLQANLAKELALSD